MKKTVIVLITILIIIFGVSRLATQIDEGEVPHVFEASTAPGIEWISVDKAMKQYDYAYNGGSWMTLEDVLQVLEKGTNLTGRDLWKYNFYEDRGESYQRIYPIADFDMLFELCVGWDVNKGERFSSAQDPVDKLIASEAILVAKDGLDTQVDFLTGDVEAYINEHKENPAHKSFGFTYYPIDVKGTADTMEMIASLWEEGEIFLTSSPDEITGLKIDKADELYAFVEEMANELKYTDKAVPENVFLKLSLNLEKKAAEPRFLIYIPSGNVNYRYEIAKVEKLGEDLYISVEKRLRIGEKQVKDGCLIGLQISQNYGEPSTIRDVTRIHLGWVE